MLDWGWEGQEEVQIQECYERGSSDHYPRCPGPFRFQCFLIRAASLWGSAFLLLSQFREKL